MLACTDVAKPAAVLFRHAHIALAARARQIRTPKLLPPAKSVRKPAAVLANFTEIRLMAPDPVDNCNAGSTLRRRQGRMAVLPDQQLSHLLGSGFVPIRAPYQNCVVSRE
jgi:hypothetical protein